MLHERQEYSFPSSEVREAKLEAVVETPLLDYMMMAEEFPMIEAMIVKSSSSYTEEEHMYAIELNEVIDAWDAIADDMNEDAMYSTHKVCPICGDPDCKARD